MERACATCGNEYDKPIQVTVNGRTEFFDCFECAIHLFAPRCAGCGLSVIGHGVEEDNVIFCFAHCARLGGKVGLSDRVPTNLIYADSGI
ncbi:MAG: hypothetical protein JNM39_14810 [Bdellovibrionaceae bacterium]|nr:hypothetical protein [Pseudobdellovibrionaceae bacterium]